MGVAVGNAGTLSVEFIAQYGQLIRATEEIKKAVNATAGESVRAHLQAEAAAERYAKKLEWEAAVVGKTADQIKRMEIELNALNAEQAGLTGLATRIRAAGAAFDDTGNKMNGMTRNTKAGLQNLSFQVNDIWVGLMSGQKPMTVFMQQGMQIVQIAQTMEGGFMGMARGAASALLPFWPLIAAAGAAYAAFALFQSSVSKDAKLDEYAKGLGLTRAEMKKLGDTSITAGDMVRGVWKTITEGLGLSNPIGAVKDFFADMINGIVDYTKMGIAGYYALWVGGFRAVLATWDQFPAAFADIFVQAVNAAIGKLNALGQATNDLLGVNLFGSIALLENTSAGAAKSVGDIWKKSLTGSFDDAMSGMDRGIGRLKSNIISAAQDRLDARAAELKGERTPKSNGLAERLSRDDKAIEAQIRNLYALAAAYQVSDAAALSAEARVKAESAAIKQRGDIEAFVARQIRLNVAERASDAAKSIAELRAQAGAQKIVNDQVAAGIVPAELAADVLRDTNALHALNVAAEVASGAEKTTLLAIIKALTAAQAGLNAEQSRAKLLAESSAATDDIARMQQELALIGATNRERAIALAQYDAEQKLKAMPGVSAEDASAYVAAMTARAAATEDLQAATDNYNASLSFQADLLDVIDQNAQNAARGMASAFGDAGRAIGDIVTAMSGYAAAQERLAVDKAEQIKKANGDAKRLAELEQLYAAKSATAQIGYYGDITSAAKGFFSEKSDAYKALETAEKAFRAIEFAMSVKAMIQGAAETAAKVAQHGVAASAAGVEAMAVTAASVPFPFNLGAMGVMAAALAALGIAVAFSGGGGGSKPTYNDGTGTVFGDTDAKSDSIKRSLDLLADIDTAMLVYSRQMAASLKNIESQIGGVTNLVLRNGLDNVEGKLGVQTGFNSALPGFVANPTAMAAAIGGIVAGPIGAVVGALASKLPVIGDILGGISSIVHSLFGSKTTVIGSGIYGGPQTLGNIDDLGFAGQTFADIKKTKKFFGVSTSKKYSTQYGDLDDGISQQFGLLLTSFGDAIRLAAGPLGLDLDDISAKLDSFVVDIGKIDLKDLSGEEIQEKLEAVFGAQADKMAQFAIGGLEQFQKVGEGYFETLVRVASTVEVVTSSLQMLGLSAQSLGVDVSMSIAGLFDSVSDYSSAATAYFETYYSEAEQVAARTSQLGKVFDSLGIAMPDSIASFRALVEAQDLTTDAGQRTYASLLQLAPAFAEIVSSGQNAASAAAILRERQDLEKQILQLQGDTAALRQRELDALDPSNRALQERIYALQDEAEAARIAAQAAQDLAAQQRAVAQERAGLERQMLQLNGDTAALRELDLQNVDESNRDLLKQIWAKQDAIAAEQAAQAAAAEAQRQAEQAAREAADAAKRLADAWRSIGDSIADEIARIRGLTETEGQSYAQLLAKFDAATAAGRFGDQDAAKSLPGLSRSLLDAAADMAGSSIDLARIQAQVLASLSTTYDVIGGGALSSPSTTSGAMPSWWQSFADSQVTSAARSANEDLVSELRMLRAEVAELRDDTNAGNAAIADNTGKAAKILDNVTRESGGNSISTEEAA
ncbi:phage tail length tape measure family protein [Sphingomonadaceae bacterium G21617-S1]|nr:phage tail length tape measure family protein [Sphingomonadaceae bacterium G21617-S1]